MKRAIRSVIRLVAVGLMIFGGLGLGLQWVQHRLQKPASIWHVIIGAVLIVLGLTLLAVSNRLAERLTDDDEE